eukprot:2791733-Rhodomonas_salina.1
MSASARADAFACISSDASAYIDLPACMPAYMSASTSPSTTAYMSAYMSAYMPASGNADRHLATQVVDPGWVPLHPRLLHRRLKVRKPPHAVPRSAHLHAPHQEQKAQIPVNLAAIWKGKSPISS